MADDNAASAAAAAAAAVSPAPVHPSAAVPQPPQPPDQNAAAAAAAAAAVAQQQHQQHQQHQQQQHQHQQQHQQQAQQPQQPQQPQQAQQPQQPPAVGAYPNPMAAQTQMMQQQTRQAQLQQQHNLQELNTKLQQFWVEQMNEVQQATDFKNHLLPLARIKKIMKSDEDVRMISAEAPVLFAKACEMFILELTHRAWAQTEEAKRRTLQRSDISAAIQKTDIFDFLIDIVPRDDPKKEDVRPVAGAVDQSQMQYYTVANVASAYAIPPQMNPAGTDTSVAMMYSTNPPQVYTSAGYAPGVAYQPSMVNPQYMRVPQQVVYAPPGYSTQYLAGGATQEQQPPQS